MTKVYGQYSVKMVQYGMMVLDMDNLLWVNQFLPMQSEADLCFSAALNSHMLVHCIVWSGSISVAS